MRQRKRETGLNETPPSARVLTGVGRRDITPPVGIYARMWGAAKHDVSAGTHRPLSTTSLVIRAGRNAPPLTLISVDLALLGDLGGKDDERRMMAPLLEKLRLDPQRVMVNCTHTHGAPWTSLSRSSMPGGALLAPYLEQIAQAMYEATREALATVAPATFTWATGRCGLAANRDLTDPEPRKKRIVCGYNPSIHADDTVLVGRVTRDTDDSMLATIVNYACHPTTLAWLNNLVSPDYIGAMREVVEGYGGGAPCLFLQGASGELAPKHQYVGDPRVADGHGRRLGYATLEALESMLPPRQRLSYRGVVESGAPLAVWWPETFNPSREVAAVGFDVPLPLKKMPAPRELEKQLAACRDRALRERLFRKLQIVKALGGGRTCPMRAWVWRVGGALFIAHCNEAYSCFQMELRKAFPDFAVVVMNVTGGEMGYLSPPELYDQNIYQVWQTPFDRGALSVLTRACKDRARRLVGNGK